MWKRFRTSALFATFLFLYLVDLGSTCQNGLSLSLSSRATMISTALLLIHSGHVEGVKNTLFFSGNTLRFHGGLFLQRDFVLS